MGERPTVEQYFMDMTQLVKARGTCPRRQVGAVIVKDKRVLTTGYNGAPRNFPHPIDQGCLRDELQIPRGMMADVCPCLHAEQNALLQAATTGVSIEGADIYCTTQPCTQCSRMIANAGIKRVCFQDEYPDPLAIGILTTAGVELWMWDPEGKALARYGKHNTFEQAQDALREQWQQDRPDLVPKSPLLGAVPDGADQKPVLGTVPDAVQKLPPMEPQEARGDTPKLDQHEFHDKDVHATADQAGVRDLRDDPGREDLIRRLAKERAAKVKAAREEAGLDIG